MNIVNKLKELITSTISEARATEWPKSNQVLQYTVAIIVLSVLLTLYISGLDALMHRGTSYLLSLGN